MAKVVTAIVPIEMCPALLICCNKGGAFRRLPFHILCSSSTLLLYYADTPPEHDAPQPFQPSSMQVLNMRPLAFGLVC
jgi:hypothetical protein